MSLLQPLPSTPDSGVVRPDSSAAAASSLLRRWTPVLVSRFGWGLYTVLCFVIFLFLTFPVDVVLQRVIASTTRGTRVQVRYVHGELTWRGASVLRNVTIEPTDTNLPTLKLSRLSVHPSWFGLVFGRPLPLSFEAELYGGTLGGTVAQSAEGFTARFIVQRLNLSLMPVPPSGKPGGIKGFLTGSGEMTGAVSQIFSLTGALELNLSEGSLQAGAFGKVPIPPLQSLQGTLRTTMRDRRLNIADFTLTGDGIEARLQGALTLDTPFPRSGLALQLTTKTVGTPPPTLVALVSLLPASPHTPGERRATISGSVAAPVLH